MKKTSKVILFAIAVSIVLGISYINMFPKAEKILLPESEKIQEIKVENINDGVTDLISNDVISYLINKLNLSVPTRRESVSEVPSEQFEDIHVLKVITKDEISTIFIYRDGESWFVEQPYRGIYKADNELVQMIEVELGRS